jgi:hypothetical protein
MLTEQRKNELIGILMERFRRNGRGALCPMCGHKHFTIADAYTVNTLQSDFNALNLGGPSIPAIAILCTNCGFISQHALGALGQLPQGEAPHGDK